MGRAQKIKAERQAARQAEATRRAGRKQTMLRLVGAVLAILIIAGALVLAFAHKSPKTTAPSQSANVASSTNPQRTEIMTIETDKGTIKLELYSDKAPKTVEQITALINRGFYNGLTFHRVEPGFVIQGGDPKGDGTGGSDLPNIPFEDNDLKHDKGVIAMARSQDKNSANSQFYITLDAAHFLDGNYVVFGKVTSGMEVVEKIAVGDKMTKVTVQ